MAHELADDAEAVGLGHVLDGGRDVVDVVAGNRGGDPGHHRLAGHVDQLADLGRRLADIEGPGGVAVPALDDGAGIDGDDLSLTDDALARDAVDDLVIDGDAQAARERAARVDARIALEGRDRAGLADVGLGDAVQVAGRHAGLELPFDEGEDLGHDAAGATHALDLGTRLAGDHVRRRPRRRWAPDP